jgi:hypothetical protein
MLEGCFNSVITVYETIGYDERGRPKLDLGTEYPCRVIQRDNVTDATTNTVSCEYEFIIRECESISKNATVEFKGKTYTVVSRWLLQDLMGHIEGYRVGVE